MDIKIRFMKAKTKQLIIIFETIEIKWQNRCLPADCDGESSDFSFNRMNRRFETSQTNFAMSIFI